MPPRSIRLLADGTHLLAAIQELARLLPAGPMAIDANSLPAELREFLLDPVFDASKLARIDSNPAADGAGDVLVSLEPSDLLLEFLSALRARDVDGNCVQAEAHGSFLSR